ncbi:MAG: amidohydrolase family protein [Thermoleophilia bacterium]
MPVTGKRLRRLKDLTARIDPYRPLLDGVEIWDIHGHIGCDIDGSVMSAAELVQRMDLLGVQKSIVFPMNDPNQGFCFSGPNEAVRQAHLAFPDRLIPFFRLNPNFDARSEYELRLSQGFKGIKLHPRSQAFEIAGPEVMRVYGWAERDGLPILIHTGRGAADVARSIRLIADRHPSLRLILGHSAAYELKDCCARCRNCDWVLFDTSSMGKEKLRELLESVDPGKVVFGSDVPFDEQAEDLLHLLEVANDLDLERETLAAILGGNLRRWLDQGPSCRFSCPLEEGEL